MIRVFSVKGEADSLVRSNTIVDGVGVGAGAGSAQRLVCGPGEVVVHTLHFTGEGVGVIVSESVLDVCVELLSGVRLRVDMMQKVGGVVGVLGGDGVVGDFGVFVAVVVLVVVDDWS